jgi:hypothetical protein
MKRIIILLTYLVFVVILFISILFNTTKRRNKNIPISLPQTTRQIAPLPPENSCLRTPPIANTNIQYKTIDIYTDETYEFNASNSVDSDNSKSITYYWQIIGNKDSINQTISETPNTLSNYKIPPYKFTRNDKAKLILVVKSNLKPFLTNSLIKELNIINLIPTIITRPSDNFNASTNSDVEIVSSSYLNDVKNIGVNHVLNEWSIPDTTGLIVNNNQLISISSNSIIISRYRFIPKTSNKVDVKITVRNANYPEKMFEKIITITYSVILSDKFTSLFQYSVVNVNNNWLFWDVNRNETFKVINNVQNKTPELSVLQPLLTDLTYLWSSQDEFSNPIQLSSNTINGNLTTFSLELKKNVKNLIMNKKYRFKCDVSYGVYSTPISIFTPFIKIIDTLLFGSISQSYIDYNLYISTGTESIFQYTEYIDSNAKTIGIRINSNFTFTGFNNLFQFINGAFTYQSIGTSVRLTTIRNTTTNNMLYFYNYIQSKQLWIICREGANTYNSPIYRSISSV